jgi:hypothetical protein
MKRAAEKGVTARDGEVLLLYVVAFKSTAQTG